MHKLMEVMVDAARADADRFMTENGLMSCWVAADNNGDVWIYGEEPRLFIDGYWHRDFKANAISARKAKRSFRFPFTIESPDQLITEICR